MESTSQDMLIVLEALANPHRMRIVRLLMENRQYVSELAREMGISRPLLYLHLKRLEQAGLVSGNLELSDDGKAMKFYEVTPFEFMLTPESIGEASKYIERAEALRENEENKNDSHEED